MLLGFKTELKLNLEQRTILAKHAGVARHAWNWGLGLTKAILDNNKANPSNKIKFPSAIDLHKWLVALVKPEHPWYYEVSKCAPQYALRQLADAWKQAFKKVLGVPRFKKKGRHDSFTLDGSITVEHFRIKVPVIGWLKTYERLPSGIKPKSVTIRPQADKWFISFKIEVYVNATLKTRDVIGVDLGVKALATLSTGEVFEGANAYKKQEFKLSRLQYKHRNKVKRSNNWKKAQIQLYGSQLVIAQRWFASSKTCWKCKTIKSELTLAERIFKCDSCGWICGRDENAALNLECYALSYSVNACGQSAADSSG